MKRFWEFCELRHLAENAIVLDDGVEATGLFIIRSGSVNVMKGNEILVQLHAGEFFGEMALIDDSARTSARIVSAEEVEVFFLARDAFDRLLGAATVRGSECGFCGSRFLIASARRSIRFSCESTCEHCFYIL